MARKRQHLEDTPPPHPRPVRRSWSFGTTLGTTASASLIVALAALGPVTAVWTTFQVVELRQLAPRSVVDDSGAASTQTAAAAAASGTALQLVELLDNAQTGDEGRIQALVMAPLDGTLKLPAKIKPVLGRGYLVVQADPVGESGWTIDVLVTTPGGASDERYRVPLHIKGALAQAIALPSRVPADQPPAPKLDTTDLTASSPINTTVAGFAASLLTGQGDIDRWCSPQARFIAITPAPYAAVKTAVVTTEERDALDNLDNPAAGDTLTVVATVVATTKDSSTTLQYPLELTARDGRWEVSALVTPQVDTATGDPSSTPSASPASPTPSPTR